MTPAASNLTVTDVAERLARITEAVQSACDRAGRNAQDVTVLAITKTFPAEVIGKACAAGLVHIGESRVQELVEKFGDGSVARQWRDMRVHLVGHLQSNKVRKAVPIVFSVDSVDGVPLAQAISRQCRQLERRARVLLEVNASGEMQKFGLASADVPPAVAAILSLEGLDLAGLMTVGPNTTDAQAIRRSFRSLRETFNKIKATFNPPGWSVLSMGMSGDYEIAVEEGATEIRLGTALFGPRGVL